MEGPEVKMAKTSTYCDDRIPGDRGETNPFTTMRNNVVLSLVGHLRFKGKKRK